MKRSLYLAAYDIANDKRLRVFLKLLRNYSTGGQKSVFECWLSYQERKMLLEHAADLMVPEEDRFMLLSIDYRQTVSVLGKAIRPADMDWYYIG